MNDKVQTHLSGGFRKGELFVMSALSNENKSKLNIVSNATTTISTMCREIKSRQQRTSKNEIQNP